MTTLESSRFLSFDLCLSRSHIEIILKVMLYLLSFMLMFISQSLEWKVGEFIYSLLLLQYVMIDL